MIRRYQLFAITIFVVAAITALSHAKAISCSEILGSESAKSSPLDRGLPVETLIETALLDDFIIPFDLAQSVTLNQRVDMRQAVSLLLEVRKKLIDLIISFRLGMAPSVGPELYSQQAILEVVAIGISQAMNNAAMNHHQSR